jgi:hypothetical protein
MKCLSLWQPWASAIACGSKIIETRHWPTAYRGPLAIHAAKRCIKAEMIDLHCRWNWCAALKPMGVQMGQKDALWDLLPFGAIVATCEMVNCRPTGSFTGTEIDVPRYPPDSDSFGSWNYWTERMMGDFSLGRYGWVFSQVEMLKTPIPCRGQRQLFEVEI